MKHPAAPRPIMPLVARTLWLLNGVAFVALLILVLYQTARLIGVLPASENSLNLPGKNFPITLAQSVSTPSNNPFDPEGLPWGTPPRSSNQEKLAGPGSGIMQFSGVSIALTEFGSAKPGEKMGDATLHRIENDHLVLQGPDGQRIIDLPAKHRPRLGQLGKPVGQVNIKEKSL
jgi:hypothetical protein